MNGQFIDSLQYFASAARDAGRGVLSFLSGTSNLAQTTASGGLELAGATVQGAKDLAGAAVQGARDLAGAAVQGTRDLTGGVLRTAGNQLGSGFVGVGTATTLLGQFTRDIGRVIQGAPVGNGN